MQLKEEYIKFLRTEKIYHSPSSLWWYCTNYIFNNINVKNKIVLDIGGGIGLLSFYCILNEAKKVILLEPQSSGSGSFQMEKFYLLKNKFIPKSNSVELIQNTFQEFNSDLIFDIIVLHNSINHLDESACTNLINDSTSYTTYLRLFQKMYHMSSNNSSLIILDCSNKNFFNDIGFKHPISRSIEWQKHQKPEVWKELLEKAGYKNILYKWSSLKQLRNPGRILFGNRFLSYLTFSHFKLNAYKNILAIVI